MPFAALIPLIAAIIGSATQIGTTASKNASDAANAQRGSLDSMSQQQAMAQMLRRKQEDQSDSSFGPKPSSAPQGEANDPFGFGSVRDPNQTLFM